MPIEIIMPKVDMVMETGTFVEWLKKEGDLVQKGDPLFVIMSDKAAIEIESPGSGKLAGLAAKKDDVMPVAQVIGYILQGTESLPAPTPKIFTTQEQANHVFTTESPPLTFKETKDSIIRATPLARKLAKQHQIDLIQVKGSGERGRIYQADLLSYLQKPASGTSLEPNAYEQFPLPEARVKSTIPLKGARQIIAKRMAYSASQIPHIYESIRVNVSELVKMREQLAPAYQKANLKITYTAFFALAVAKTLLQYPNLNASLHEEKIMQWEDVHIGIATSIEDYLIVPVIREVQSKSLKTIVIELNRLLEAAREHHLESKEMSGSTFTISNLGMYGIEAFSALINPPEAAILAVGAIEDMPCFVSGAWISQPQMRLVLGADHRINDGVSAARFLVDLKEKLENPYLLL